MNTTDRIFELMKKNNITQSKMAEVLNTKQSTISGWKNRGSIPSTKHLKNICDYFNVSMDYLSGNDKDINDLPKNYYDFAKDLRDMGATDEDFKKIIKFIKMIKEE